MFDKLSPLGKRVLVECNTVNEIKTSSGLIVNIEESGSCKSGKVISYGVHTSCVQMGDTIYFDVYSATSLEGDHFIIDEDKILGIFKQ